MQNAMGEALDPSLQRRRTRKDETKNGKIILPKSAEGEIQRPAQHHHLGKNGCKTFMAHGSRSVAHYREGEINTLEA